MKSKFVCFIYKSVHYNRAQCETGKSFLLKCKWKFSVLCNKLLCKNLDNLHHLTEHSITQLYLTNELQPCVGTAVKFL